MSGSGVSINPENKSVHYDKDYEYIRLKDYNLASDTQNRKPMRGGSTRKSSAKKRASVRRRRRRSAAKKRSSTRRR
jgi:hypothetical protein